ncbi:transcription factor bHLH155-like isoform X1 [Senna tora]|uniref:Transcription factor bHLH155-like isoform X1 n=1 Tax=Senna tora TaxID=362788 RepID=A0A834SHQ1_9FABA|nr:transcription factor bHLH155-like isoform X1 [Senna tora]
MKMAANMHQLLRSLCLNTDWKYAIFWKLKHRARMILTWEDAYYDNPDDYDSLDNKSCQKTLEQIHGGHFSHDPLGLAVAKMSYHVYSLGEGIIGQVAVTGKHQWICADNHAAGSGSSFEFADGWQSQFSAGIRTIVVVAIVPLGVVQLGSLNKVIEDMGLVTHIRNIFLATQDYSIDHGLSQILSGVKNSSSLPDVSMTKSSSEIVPAHLQATEEATKTEKMDILMPFPCSGKNFSPRAVYKKMAVDVTKHGRPEFCSNKSSVLLQSVSNMMNVEHQKIVDLRSLNERKFEGDCSGCKDVVRVESEKNVTSLLQNSFVDNNSFSDLICPYEKIGADFACFHSDFPDVVGESDKLHYLNITQKEVLSVPRPSNASSQKDTEKSELQNEPCYKSPSYSWLKFPAGCELHEALGPAFMKSRYLDSEAQMNQDVKTMEMPDEISCSQLTCESRPEHLLEAIVANVCHSNNDVKSELSYSTSVQSAMVSERNPEASVHTVHTLNSEGYPIDQSSLVREDIYCTLTSSGNCGAMSPRGISSMCPSSCSEQFERSSEPSKNKKRARPGESCRPRPRDRQLIQDRIKELRELVPSGAKCSIDSLLERTIKHMLFLQSITKHADKLNKFADSKTKAKLHHMESAVPGSSSYEQGSSWAMEVGGHLKVHSILVENLSKNGQMLVEMLCEECSHFLEIAEAIRSLGLTILKGATEAHGSKQQKCTQIGYLVAACSNTTVQKYNAFTITGGFTLDVNCSNGPYALHFCLGYNRHAADTLGPTRPASTLCSTLLNLSLVISYTKRKSNDFDGGLGGHLRYLAVEMLGMMGLNAWWYPIASDSSSDTASLSFFICSMYWLTVSLQSNKWGRFEGRGHHLESQIVRCPSNLLLWRQRGLRCRNTLPLPCDHGNTTPSSPPLAARGIV